MCLTGALSFNADDLGGISFSGIVEGLHVKLVARAAAQLFQEDALLCSGNVLLHPVVLLLLIVEHVTWSSEAILSPTKLHWDAKVYRVEHNILQFLMTARCGIKQGGRDTVIISAHYK